MSALKWARAPRPGLGGPASAVLRDLADRANESGVCWPSLATIAADTGYCERTVRYALRRLEQHGLLTVKQTGRGSRYTFPAAALTGKSCRSEGQELPLRGARDAPKASRSEKKPLRARARTAPDEITVDEEMLHLARDWLGRR
jgi:hypothetical protein